jgi:Tfp pilus assembly protein PilV
MISNRSKRSQSGTTLAETVIAAAIIGIFFAAIFELNALCLRYIDASKESVAALQGVQDRVEALRNLDFTKLTDATYVQNLMVNPANGSDFAKTKATERVSIDKYDTTTNPPTVSAGVKFKRLPSAIVTRTGSLPSGAAVVLVNVKYTWSMLGGRSGSEQTETIISSGTKK